MTPSRSDLSTPRPRVTSTPRLLTIHDLRELLRCGRTTAYARVHETDFPTPIALSGSAHRWWEHEVIEWIERHRLGRGEMQSPRPTEKLAVTDDEPRAVHLRRRSPSR